jgi:hypothetical protein
MSENVHYVEFLVELQTRAFLHLIEQEHQGIVLHHQKRRGFAMVGRIGTFLIKLGSLLEGLALTEERMAMDV